ncbi:UNVERIFIED_CONTAM: hypothetical protein H355_004176 [Colinus virginianus]|nr:hypothetical protein H355_004176 [Colinus virginianus]
MRSRLDVSHSVAVGALIVTDVHAKDVVERLREDHVYSLTAFEWISQLRYYWRDEGCCVQCVQTDLPYGYEYLGNTSRLVLTPLTDMAYMTLMGAQLLNLDNMETEFEGSQITVLPVFNVYITMNPGYPGRSELPDNLKSLFRPMAMMIPDYTMIGEIMLFSFGFDNARELSKKMIATFKLASEQLSACDHYDYGMRAVRSVINAVDEQRLLLRALIDVNVPKFLVDDLLLFDNIIGDLFPGVKCTTPDHKVLAAAVRQAALAQGLQPTPAFVGKAMQMYDTMQVRQGMMLIGPTGGGKTSCYRTLRNAISGLHGKSNFSTVYVHTLNPKAVTIGQLYGQFNELTHEWTDGVVAVLLRQAVRNTSGDRHWILFDGPVDALWIESMNSVLDDNKKLCLNSGEIILLTPLVTVMFEAEDLSVASPATVSRCGMVYMEPQMLDLNVLITSWLDGLPCTFQKQHRRTLEEILSLLPEAVTFVRNQAKEVIRIVDTAASRFRFSEWLIRRLEKEKADIAAVNFQENAGVFDVCFDMQGPGTWVPWREIDGGISDFVIQREAPYERIVVPTVDSQRMTYILKLLLSQRKHVLCSGAYGTGKSVNIGEYLCSRAPEDVESITFAFSAQSHANQTQDLLEERLEKRRRGVIGPLAGKRFVIFIDDFNMPRREEFGAQPPLELLRQWNLCKPHGIRPTRTNIFNEYLKRIHANTHIILVLSPMTDQFRRRLRTYPALTTCCTIDYFSEIEIKMAQIQQDRALADDTKVRVGREEYEASEKAAKTQALKDEAQRDLDEALPALDEAVECLKKLKAEHVREIKALTKPPAGVLLTMEAVCIMFQENIPETVVSKIAPYIGRQDFDPAAIRKASVACEAICTWVRAMLKYYFVTKAVEPKRVKLRQAEGELLVTMQNLNATKAKLQAVENKIARLAEEFATATKKKMQATRFIKALGRTTEQGFEVCRMTDDNFCRELELAIHFGKWMLVESATATLDSFLEPILLYPVLKENQRLEEQLLALIVSKEAPELEEKKNIFVTNNARMRKELKVLEDKILQLLSQSQGDILEDEALVATLAAAKFTAEEMNKKVEEVELTEHEIDKARQEIACDFQHSGSTAIASIVSSMGWSVQVLPLYSNFWRAPITALGFEACVTAANNGIKIVSEPPEGLRANLLRLYASQDQHVCEGAKKPEILRKLSFAFCFFHAVVQDRKKFGPIGWNVEYEFTVDDLLVCQRQLRILLDIYEEVPYQVLVFLGAKINYGGRITDAFDKRLIECILKSYVNAQMIEQGPSYKFSTSGLYYCPDVNNHSDYVQYIRSLPLDADPEAFGLHENANIKFAQSEGMVRKEFRSVSSGKTREQAVDETVSQIAEGLPESFDLETIRTQYGICYFESLNAVLIQEVVRYATWGRIQDLLWCLVQSHKNAYASKTPSPDAMYQRQVLLDNNSACVTLEPAPYRYNGLLRIMRKTMGDLRMAIRGQVLMTEELEGVASSIFDNVVIWSSRSVPNSSYAAFREPGKPREHMRGWL